MAIGKTARKNHDELFPDHASTLAVTDPELIQVFDNFAFDEVPPTAGSLPGPGPWPSWQLSSCAGRFASTR